MYSAKNPLYTEIPCLIPNKYGTIAYSPRNDSMVYKKKGALQLKGSLGIQVTVFPLSQNYYGMRRVLTIRTMTAMTSTAPTAITAQSR